jgi:glycosyltransferase involved in cell wall biosynthesis
LHEHTSPNSSLRILIIAHAFPPQVGGVETHLWDICRHLCKRGHEVLCLVGGPETNERCDRVEVVRHPAFTVQYLLAQRETLARDGRDDGLRAELSRVITQTLSRFEPDVIHAHNLLHFAPELAEALITAAERMPIVSSVHDRIGEHLFPEVMALPWAHTLFASQYLKTSLPACAPSSVLWLGVELDKFSPHGSRDSRFAQMERPIIFHPARLLRWKGVEVSLEAFGLLRNRIGRGTLVMCASENAATDQQEIRSLRQLLTHRASQAGIADRLHFLELGQADMPGAYRASDLIWYPTIDEEPLGLVPIEAMACGVPLVVSDSGGMRETVLNNLTGLVVARNDAAALSAAGERLLTDTSLREGFIERGRERAERFDNSRYVDQLVSVYARVLLKDETREE